MKKKIDPSLPKEYVRHKTGNLIPCPGEAHSNSYIDNCMQCAPRWGQIDELEPFSLVEARVDRLDIPGWMPGKDDRTELEQLEKDGKVKLVMVTNKNRSYFVWRWQ